MKLFRYMASAMVAVSLLASCSDDVVAERRPGADSDPLTIKAQFGKNLVGRVTVDGQPRQGVVVSDGINVMTTDANGEYQMYTTGRQHVFISVPADCELPTLLGDPEVLQDPRLFRRRDHPARFPSGVNPKENRMDPLHYGRPADRQRKRHH